MRLVQPKTNFLKKVAFWAQAKNAFKMRNIYGPQEVYNGEFGSAFCKSA